jgi:hypothetical protein
MPLTANQEAKLPPALKNAILAKQNKNKDDKKKPPTKPKTGNKMYK